MIRQQAGRRTTKDSVSRPSVPWFVRSWSLGVDEILETGIPAGGRKRLLEARRLERRAGGRSLLADVSIEIHAGDRLAIVGPTGSGKTLLLRALAMLDPVDSGSILWQAREVHGHDVPTFRSRVIYLHQRPALTDGTVEAILRQPFLLKIHRGKRYDPAFIVARLATLGRDESFLARHVRDLSGGESQIVAMLRVMQLDPQVLLLDEPTSALDPQATEMVEQLVDSWTREQPAARATLWVTHSRQQAERIADRVLTMQNGSLQEVP